MIRRAVILWCLMLSVGRAEVDVDPMSKEVTKGIAQRENEGRFLEVFGHVPTVASVRKVIQSPLVQKPSSLVAALDVVGGLRSDEHGGEALAADIEALYDRDVRGVVRMSCVSALLNIDVQRGGRLGTRFLEEEISPLQWKILAASVLLKQGVLSGYRVLGDAIATPDDYSRRLGVQLFDAFRKFDGDVWNDNGDRVDLKDLLRQVTASVSKVSESVRNLSDSLR
jgi:hypothetical protein